MDTEVERERSGEGDPPVQLGVRQKPARLAEFVRVTLHLFLGLFQRFAHGREFALRVSPLHGRPGLLDG